MSWFKRKNKEEKEKDPNDNNNAKGGGLFGGFTSGGFMDVIARKENSIYTVVCTKWTNELVCEYIRYISTEEKDTEQYVDIFKKNNIAGADLTECTQMDFLKELGISKGGDRLYIKRCIQELLDSETKMAKRKPKEDGSDLFDVAAHSTAPADLVKAKIFKSKNLRTQFETNAKKDVEGTRELLDEFIKGLCDVQWCKGTYFNLDWKQTLEKTSRLNKLGGGEEEEEEQKVDIQEGVSGGRMLRGDSSRGGALGMSSKPMSTDVTTIKRPTTGNSNGNESDPSNELENGQEYSQEFALEEIRNPKGNSTATVKVKFVLTDIGTNKSLRKFLSPIMRQTDWAQEFGMFHSALIVGPWYIEWTDSALCIPRRISSSSALLSCDIKEIALNSNEIDKIAQKLSEIVVEWNINKQYKNFGGNKILVGNCQDFVMEVANRLGFDLKFNGYMSKFIQKMRDEGKCELGFEPTKEFCSKFNLKPDNKNYFYRFQTHQQLDRFVNQLVAADMQFRFNYRDEWAILKSFDRAFWLRHIKYKERAKQANAAATSRDEMIPENDPTFEPLWKDICKKDHDCPFDDPITTNSFVPLY